MNLSALCSTLLNDIGLLGEFLSGVGSIILAILGFLALKKRYDAWITYSGDKLILTFINNSRHGTSARLFGLFVSHNAKNCINVKRNSILRFHSGIYISNNSNHDTLVSSEFTNFFNVRGKSCYKISISFDDMYKVIKNDPELKVEVIRAIAKYKSLPITVVFVDYSNKFTWGYCRVSFNNLICKKIRNCIS